MLICQQTVSNKSLKRKENSKEKIFFLGLKYLLIPLCRFCINRSIKIQDIFYYLKICLIKVAKEELKLLGEKESISKISIMTGLQRKDIVSLESKQFNNSLISENLLSKIINLWGIDKKYTQPTGAPKPLTYTGRDSQFQNLVEQISKDLNYHTVLFDLERLNLVTKDAEYVSLISNEKYLTCLNPDSAYKLLSNDISDLILTVENNISSRSNNKNLHATTKFDNIPAEAIPVIRKWMQKTGNQLHLAARKMLSRYDLDCNPKKLSEKHKHAKYQVSICAFSTVTKINSENNSAQAKKRKISDENS
jgi:hypothetical protein